jgi:hypothetical protein
VGASLEESIAYQCSAPHKNMLIAPRTTSAPRHPAISIRSWISGMKTVLAKPPHSVSAVIPRRAPAGPARLLMTAKAGS